MKKLLTTILLFILLLSGCAQEENKNVIDDNFIREDIRAEEIGDCPVSTVNNDYEIVWNDEFNYTGAPDPNKWSYEIGTGNWGWGNNESQYYTERLDNSKVEDGNLIITAKKEDYNGSDYTSARLVSRGKGDFKYGYIEMSAKLPGGRGAWAAFWMMPTDSVYGIWPNSGEIDIMEYVGNNKNRIFGTVHNATYYGSGNGKTINRANVDNEYHRYGIEWTEDSIKIMFDGEVYHTYQNPKYSVDNYKRYPYDQRFFLILNIAMGGNLGGYIPEDFTETSMYVDYVRVYQKNLKGIDVEKPEKTIFTTVNSSASTINLMWEKASDNYGVKQYDIVLNGKQIAATSKTNYVIKDLKPNTEYTVQIITVDHANNFSVSSPVFAKTKDVLRAPGKLEIEEFIDSNNINLFDNANNTKSVEISKQNGSNGYIICSIDVKESKEYNISVYAMCQVAGGSIYIYSVNENYEGTKPTPIMLKPTFGSYVMIEINYKIKLEKGINYIKIEGELPNDGKVITIDYIELT